MKKRIANKVMPKKVKCIRCGICCIIAPCGVQDEAGICSYLIIHKEGYTTCKYIEENGNIFSGGCFLRRSKEVYELHREEAEGKVGIKLVGIRRM